MVSRRRNGLLVSVDVVEVVEALHFIGNLAWAQFVLAPPFGKES